MYRNRHSNAPQRALSDDIQMVVEMTNRPGKKERKAHIIQAAAEVFAEKGFSKTLVAEVASAADIGKGTIYEYFRSKDDLFFAVFEYYVDQSAGAAEMALTGAAEKDARGKLVVLNRALASWISAHRHIYSLSMEFWSASVSASPELRERFDQSFKEIYRTFRKIVSDIIQEGMTAGIFNRSINPRAIASGILGAWDGLGLQSFFDPDVNLEQTADVYMELVINGLLREATRNS